MRLFDCVSPDPKASELFIAQDGPLGELAKGLRDRYSQAVLLVGETIVDGQKAELDDVFDNEDFGAIAVTLGVGLCLPDREQGEQTLNLDRLRYDKIVLVTDRSRAGKYIGEQVLALFHRFLHPVLSAGHVYIAPVNPLASSSEFEFEFSVMLHPTRRLIPVRLGKTLRETLRLTHGPDA